MPGTVTTNVSYTQGDVHSFVGMSQCSDDFYVYVSMSYGMLSLTVVTGTGVTGNACTCHHMARCLYRSDAAAMPYPHVPVGLMAAA